jgi:hypothetical protein
MWTASRSWARPAAPTWSPRTTRSPRTTSTESRYDRVVTIPRPWSMLTDNRPATEPAKVTTPAATAATGSPASAA